MDGTPYHKDVALHHLEIGDQPQLAATRLGFVKELPTPLEVRNAINGLVVSSSDKGAEGEQAVVERDEARVSCRFGVSGP